MRPQHSHHRNHRSKLIALIVISILLASATPVLADYIGPNRTVTETVSSGCKVTLLECQYVSAKNDYLYHKVNEWSCSNESKPWQNYSSQPSSQGCSASNIGDQYWDRNETVNEVTKTYPAATITGGIQNCTLSNGWCTTAAQLSLSADEPVPGYTIIGIEGTLNNQLFACTGSTCLVPLAEGVNNFTFWAHSSWTDTSQMGTLTARKDSQPPLIAGTLNGAAGLNGWYTSPVAINISVSDPASGVAGVTCTLDGSALGSCKSISVSGEGMHTLTVVAKDNANLTRTFTQNSSIDTQNPELNVSIVGTRSSDTDWYTAASLKGSASDALPGSGLSAFQYRLNYGNWDSFPSSGELGLPEGRGIVEVRAIDKAGLTASSEKSYWLDKTAPTIVVLAQGAVGPDNWYTSDIRISAEALDDLSGVHLFEYSLDNDSKTAYSNPVNIGEGVHDITFWAEDEAGLTSEWSQTYKVDSLEPIIGGDLSGVPGENGWFISDVTLSASAFDRMPGSGIETFTYRLDEGPETPYTDPLVLSEGQHYVQLNARDKADHTFILGQAVKVDTSLPSLSIQTTLPAWIKDSFAFEGTASDNGSGLSKVEISTDGEQTWQAVTGKDSWSYTWITSDAISGLYQIAVRATDKAGLVTKQTLNTGIDKIAPSVTLPASWLQWDTIALNISDEFSGLAEAYMEITDPQNRWPARTIRLDSAAFPLQIKWDRRFADDTVAPAGTYDVKVVAVDKLGNSTSRSASITVLLEILPPGPTATLVPTTLPLPTPTIQLVATPTVVYTVPPQVTITATQSLVVKSFGSTAVTGATATPRPAASSTPRATPTQITVLDRFESIFSPKPETTESTIQISSQDDIKAGSTTTAPVSNVLWGATAAAVMGSVTAYALEEKRKQEEEKARQAALEAQEDERREYIHAQRMTKLEAQWAKERAEEAAREAKEQQQEARYQAHMEARVLDREVKEEMQRVAEQKAIRERNEEKRRAEEEKKKAEDLQAGLAAYYNGRKQGEAEAAAAPKEKSVWEKGLDWIDEHQTEVALGLGVAVGVAAVVLSGGIAAPMVAAAWVAGATAVAAGAAAAGTIALNNHYGREWNSNLLKNVAVAGAGAAVVSAGWFAFQIGTTAAGAYCVSNPAPCARVEPVLNAIDKAEELTLNGKLAYYTWRGNEEKASEAALDLQTEYLDGGMPGNAFAKNLSPASLENIAQYGDEALELVAMYGDDSAQILFRYGEDALDLIDIYGDDAAQLILNHGDEGFALLQKYGGDVFKVVEDHGDLAVDVLKAVDPKTASKLFEAVDDDILDYTSQQGPDALEALSRWSIEDLSKYGPEIALRSKRDARVLADVDKLVSLGPIDPKNLTAEQRNLIDSIAEYSTQYADGGQLVLGKWVDFGSGFVEHAQDTGSVHYNPHPDMWNKLGVLGKDRNQVAWLINQQVIQTTINKGLPVEYTLNGIPIENIRREKDAIEAVFSGATNTQIMNILKTDYLPIRMQEIQELQKAGYKLSFDMITNTYILIRP